LTAAAVAASTWQAVAPTGGGVIVFEQVQHEQRRPVVVVGSQGSADLLVATFRVHGIEAVATPASVYPSLDWVEGTAVAVADADAARARELVRDLGHDPVEPS
jgi:hypothetical protein